MLNRPVRAPGIELAGRVGGVRVGAWGGGWGGSKGTCHGWWAAGGDDVTLCSLS